MKSRIGHVEVFRMDDVETSIIGRPRPLLGHDTPNAARNTYTLNYQEPANVGAARGFPRAAPMLRRDVKVTLVVGSIS